MEREDLANCAAVVSTFFSGKAADGAALRGFDSEDMEDLVVELEKEEGFSMDVRMKFEACAGVLKKQAQAE